MAEDIAQWLEGIGLGRYAKAFADNDVDLRSLPFLTDDDLIEIGLSLGHRRLLQNALRDQGFPGGVPSKDAVAPDAQPDAERRQLTVLFCDLVGSTELSANLDPEDMRDLLRSYQEACAAAVARYDGFVARYLGDGILAYFGYPGAHENDAERAVNTGLAMVAAVKQLDARRTDGVRLAVRVGMATGNVAVGDLVGEGASEEASVVGSAPNLAARLQGIAEPDTVVIGEVTHALTRGMFETRDLGARDLKGFADPVGVFEVLRPRAAESRFAATRGDQLVELVGRDEELEILLRRWNRAKAGEGQVVLISGEPGIGKSRLARALLDRIEGESPITLRYQCSPYHTSSALFPVIEQIERDAGFEAGDDPDEKRDKLTRVLSGAGELTDEAVALIGSMLAVSPDRDIPALGSSPQHQKELTLVALADHLAGLARKGPVVMVFEDAHWVDPTTLEFLDVAIERVVRLPILMLVTHRPEFDAPWLGRSRVTSIILNRLEPRECAAMIDHVARRSAIAADMRDTIIAQSDGVPLFLEELANAASETATGGTSAPRPESDGVAIPLDIPPALRESLAARLDRLGPARDLAQIAACIGRSFSRSLLAATKGVADPDLDEGLSALVESGLIYPQRQRDGSGFVFKHALVQQAAYAGLLRSTRRKIHGDIAAAMIARQDLDQGGDIAAIARHLSDADRIREALPWVRRAAQRAANSGSAKEAMEILNHGLELLARLDGPAEDRDRAELGMLMEKLPVSVALTGWATDEVETVSARALNLAESLGDKNLESAVLYQIATMHEVRGEYSKTQSTLARRDAVVGAHPEPDQAVESGELMACSTFYQGRFDTSIEHARQALDHVAPDKPTALGAAVSEDPTVSCLFWLAKAMLLRGQIDQAMARQQEALDYSRRSPNWYAASQAEVDGAVFAALQRDFDLARERAAHAIEMSGGVGLVYREAIGVLIHEWAGAVGHGTPPDVEKLSNCLDIFRQVGAMIGLGFYLSLAAEALEVAGERERSDRLIEDAIEHCRQSRGFFFESEVHRLQGELTLRRLAPGGTNGVEAHFQRALEIARAQGAHLFELRGATSLADYWRERGEPAKARDLLRPIYDGFTEGFGTADLTHAAALLAALD